ncbi:hypothetical protein CLOM_g1035 [Closterium sp. NIES-68]|nr:hypothetical protein CLOM_g1035 [Closterium sp. NIES-68]GJP63024.1 hypothetical protein CLOP_g20076 [Closterium sp. NIES-67]
MALNSQASQQLMSSGRLPAVLSALLPRIVSRSLASLEQNRHSSLQPNLHSSLQQSPPSTSGSPPPISPSFISPPTLATSPSPTPRFSPDSSTSPSRPSSPSYPAPAFLPHGSFSRLSLSSLHQSLSKLQDSLVSGSTLHQFSCHHRSFSNLPDSTVYGGPKPESQRQRVTLQQVGSKYRRGEPIVMVTAYDYPSAVHVDMADIDICLVGDSAAMVVHGYDTTLPITLEDMLLHCRAVARGASRPLLVGDLPFGTYEQSPQQAVESAVRLLKEGNMDAVKIEGGIPARVAAARAVSEAGIAVMGHVGLTPQAISSLGGFRPQGRSAASALKVVQHAQALQEAGCFAVVLECMPAVVAAAVTAAVDIPTIGIGAGPLCSGQVLVYHDLLGMIQHPHHAKVTPKFCKAFGQVGEAIQQALNAFREDVTTRAFPSALYSPYKIDDAQIESFAKLLKSHGLTSSAEAAEAAAETAAADADRLSKIV